VRKDVSRQSPKCILAHCIWQCEPFMSHQYLELLCSLGLHRSGIKAIRATYVMMCVGGNIGPVCRLLVSVPPCLFTTSPSLKEVSEAMAHEVLGFLCLPLSYFARIVERTSRTSSFMWYTRAICNLIVSISLLLMRDRHLLVVIPIYPS
jgi:hypothetical protein